MEIKNAEVELTYRHKENGEVFKDRKDWEMYKLLSGAKWLT